jgi:hypothetical protein
LIASRTPFSSLSTGIVVLRIFPPLSAYQLSAILQWPTIFGVLSGDEMDAQSAKKFDMLARKAERRWLRRMGITRESAIKLTEIPWWKTPSGEHLARTEKEGRAYKKLQKGRPTREFLARLEEALYSNDRYEHGAALRLWKEITILPIREAGRTKLIPDRVKIRDEARDLEKAGLSRNEIVTKLADRHGASPSYVRRILEDSVARDGEHRTFPSNQTKR